MRDTKQGPILVHVVTKKGKGYGPAEASDDKYHGVARFNVVTGAQVKPKPNAPTYTRVFADSLIAEAQQGQEHRRHHGRHAGRHRPRRVRQGVPDRTFDVGIAEQHAVTFAAGLAHRRPEAVLPRSTPRSCSAPTTRSCTTSPSSTCRCASPSTAPASSAPTARRTPARSISPISAACPDFVIMAAADEAELVHMVATAAHDRRPPLRLPLSARRGLGHRAFRPKASRSRSARAASCARASAVAILSLGTRLGRGAESRRPAWPPWASSATVADARFMKPLDHDLIARLAQEHEVLVTIEEGSVGGFGSACAA